MNLFVFSSAFKAIFTNLHVIGRYGPTTLNSRSQVRIMTNKLHCLAVFNKGLYRILWLQNKSTRSSRRIQPSIPRKRSKNEWRRYLAAIYYPDQPIRQRGETKTDRRRKKFEYSVGFAAGT